MSVAHESGQLLRWPYVVNYGKERNYEVDVLVIGGGIAGVWAAIAAARAGAKVIILEKAATERSGAGGAGVDHWQWAADNPASRVTPEELAQALIDNQGGYRSGIGSYIQCASAWETLAEMEAMGGKVRDSEDEFRGADFRDENTRLLFAYDYTNRFVIRVWGHNYKPPLRNELKAVTAQADIIEKMTAQGQTPIVNTAEEFIANYRAEYPKWDLLIKASGAKIE